MSHPLGILVTAGPTREYLDSVRFLSNASSGKQGYAIAQEFAARGHRVTLVSGPVELAPPRGVEVVRVISAAEMFDAAMRAFEGCDAAIMAAAVCDYRPTQRQDRKLPKKSAVCSLQLEPTSDVCASLGSIKGNRLVMGFALEDHDGRHHAEEKLRRKRCDAIVLNSPRVIGEDRAEVQVFLPDEHRVAMRDTDSRGDQGAPEPIRPDQSGWLAPWSGTKAEIAGKLADLTEFMMTRGRN